MYTTEVAKIVGIHPNTVRLYETWGYISPVRRAANGYRQFEERHVVQLKIARLAFGHEFIQNNLRKYAIRIAKLSGAERFDAAKQAAANYIQFLKMELTYSEQAIERAERLLMAPNVKHSKTYTHREVAKQLQLTEETIRNWERNGLFDVTRNVQNRRQYTELDVQKLYVIRTLRSAHFSIASIHHLFTSLHHETLNVRDLLCLPTFQQEFYHVNDALQQNLKKAMIDVTSIIALLETL